MFRAVQSLSKLIPAPMIYDVLGISQPRLSYWIKTGILRPRRKGKKGYHKGGKHCPTLLSFHDFMELKTLVSLRRQGLSLQRIRKVLDYIRSKDYRLHEIEYITDGHLFFIKEDDNQIIEIGNKNQFVLLNWREIVRFCRETFENYIRDHEREAS